MKPTTIRFSERQYEEIARRSRENGIGVSQYVREAVVAYMAYERGLEVGRRDGVDVDKRDESR
jgi:hypothetical protein